MIEIQAYARLHFGLLDVGSPPAWINANGETIAEGRRFGGVGLMIDQPRLAIRARPAKSWHVCGPLSERVLRVVHRLKHSLPEIRSPDAGRSQNLSESSHTFPPLEIALDEAPPEHAGFGCGTQLELAVARVMAASVSETPISASELARWTGRGFRSAVGVYGFERGGLIVEGGKRGGESLSPLVFHASLPSDWWVVTALLEPSQGRFGEAERWAFDQVQSSASSRESMCQLILLELIPALLARDCRLFGEVVYDLNARAGKMFASVQKGRYAFPAVAEALGLLRLKGIRGVGQSSWGPAIFAIVEDVERAEWTRRFLTQQFPSAQIWLAQSAGPAKLTR